MPYHSQSRGDKSSGRMTIYEENRFILIADSPFKKRILFNWRGNISANERASERSFNNEIYPRKVSAAVEPRWKLESFNLSNTMSISWWNYSVWGRRSRAGTQIAGSFVRRPTPVKICMRIRLRFRARRWFLVRWAAPFHSFIFTRRSDSPRLSSSHPLVDPIFRAGWEVLECAVYKYRLGRPSFANCTWLLFVPIREQPARWTSERAALEAARGRSPSIIVPESLAVREIHRVSWESWQHFHGNMQNYILLYIIQ